MKNLVLLFGLILVVVSCKKEINSKITGNSLMEDIRLKLADSLLPQDFRQLDFSSTVVSTITDDNFAVVRIGFVGMAFETDFIVLRLAPQQTFSSGKIVHIKRSINGVNQGDLFNFNGSIQIYSLDRSHLVTSTVKDGFISAFHPVTSAARAPANAVIIPALPEIIIVSALGVGGAWASSTLYNTQSMLAASGQTASGYYNYGSGSGGTPTGSLGAGSGSEPKNEPFVSVDFEEGIMYPAIDLNAYLKCFNNIPDAGSTCSITIYTDVPVNGQPKKFFNFKTGSPGHTFIKIKKSNGLQTVQQNIGFYPQQGWKTGLTTAPVDGKLVDNTGHEFNASFEVKITADQLQRTLTHMQSLARFVKYDVDEYNCTDFALDVFNYTISNKLTIPLYPIPGGMAAQGTSTPQGLFEKLVSLKNGGGTQATNVLVPGVMGFVSDSNGPCN